VNEFNNGVPIHTSYAYDPVRQISCVTDDKNNVTSVDYDLFGRRAVVNNPDAGLAGTVTTALQSGGSPFRFADASRNLIVAGAAWIIFMGTVRCVRDTG